MLQWIKRSVARQAGAIVAGSLSTVALFVWVLGVAGIIPTFPVEAFMLWLAWMIPAAGLFGAWVTQRLVGSRLAHLAEVIDGTGPNDDLARIRDLGPDEVGAIGQAINRLLARITSIRASMIDQRRELGKAQQELELKARLAEKTIELEQRLEERQMLFDIMRMTSGRHELDDVLRTLVERVGQLLRLREVVMFLFDETLEAFAVQATYGFKREGALKGRTLKLGEGISGSVGMTRAPVIIADVGQAPGYLGFWGEAERSGSLAAVPIIYREKLLGVLTVTRPEHDPVTDVHLKLLSAIADNAAMAMRNAQLFERMRELTSHDELTELANQRLLKSHLDREIDRARRFEKPLAVLLIEIDHFQAACEQHGAKRGDVALRSAAQVLTRNIRKIDTVGRLDGAQFMVLLPRSEQRDALNVAEKLRKLVAVQSFFDGSDGKLTASIGVAQLQQSDDDHGDSMLGRATQALQTARQSGRNRVCSGEPPARLERTLQ